MLPEYQVCSSSVLRGDFESHFYMMLLCFMFALSFKLQGLLEGSSQMFLAKLSLYVQKTIQETYVCFYMLESKYLQNWSNVQGPTRETVTFIWFSNVLFVRANCHVLTFSRC